MRQSLRCLALLLVVVFVSLPATEARWGKKKRRAEPGTFELQSELVSQIPEVRQALDRMEADPESPEAWQALGQALAEAGDYPDALEALDRALDLAPGNPEILTDIGATHIRAGEAGDAVDPLEEAIEIEPFYATAHYNLGLAHQQLGNYDRALDAFEAALMIEPELGDPRLNPAVLNNPDIGVVRLRVYLRTTGATPSVFSK